MEPDKTLIDTDASIEGTLKGKDARVLGRFKGDIELKGRLTLGEGCSVEAKVLADTAEIAGEFKGDLVVEKLILHEKARVSGTVDARVLSVREGAQMNGAVNAGEGRKAATSALAKPVAPIPPLPPKPTGATTG
jgi:cytoskeletal protein CcmA (bactofilin family)